MRGADEARSVLSDLYSECTLEPARDQPFDGVLDLAQLGPVGLASISWTAGCTVVAPTVQDRYIVVFAREAGAQGVYGGLPFSVTPGRTGAVCSPGRSVRFEAASGYRGRTIVLPREALEAHVVALTGQSSHGPIHFDSTLDLESGSGAVISAISGLLWDEVHREGASPRVINALREALMTSLLTGLKHSASALFEAQAPRIAPRHVRRAEEYIEANAAQPIALADIAAAAGVSVRSLQVGFKEYRGVTPMEALRRRRFDLVRHRLLHAESGRTVAELMAGLPLGGIGGRFSVDYRRRFGESPSETLARARLG